MWLRCGRISYLKSTGKFSRAVWYLQHCSISDVSHKRTKLAPLQERRMIDRFRLWAKGGDGGNGCVSFRRSRHDRRGRPDGGNGGRGGDVVLESSRTVWDFSSLQHHVNAKKGGHGASKNLIGSRGADKVVQVPVGTVIHLVKGEIPSGIEIKSCAVLEPWEIPGPLDSEHEFSQNSSNTHRSGTKEASSKNNCYGPIVEESTKCFTHSRPELDPSDQGPKQPHKMSISKYNSELEEEVPTDSWADEGCEWQDWETDALTSGPFSEEESNEEDQIQFNVAELTEPGQRITIAQGGEGGLGNVAFVGAFKRMQKNYKFDSEVSDDDDSSRRAGLPGSEVILMLELKSIADVGLVGMPNVGKSTLLGAMSKARPIVGNYAFTTLRPNLGNLNYDDFSITVADIPGLITGAHENRGLGHAFLRHIERTKVLAFVVDLAAGLDGRKGLPPWEQLRDLIAELEFYREGLSDRPSLVVANKIDEPGAEEVYEELKHRVPGVPIFPVCAVLEEGVPQLKASLKKLVGGEVSYRLTPDVIVVD